MGETESRPVQFSDSPSSGRGRERSESTKDRHIRLQEEEREAKDGTGKLKARPKGEVLIFIRYPDVATNAGAEGSGEGSSFTNEHFRALLGMLQKCAPDWVISLEAKKTESFAEQVTSHNQACATGQNPKLPIINVAVIYAFDSTPKHDSPKYRAPPGDHGTVVASLNSSLNPQSTYHVRLRWDVTTKAALERSALQLIGF